ncbi:hypothetical protein TUN_32770 [Bacillus sp. M21]|nr:hypothetical protein TUN_32770 [Bacillus sp. M21]
MFQKRGNQELQNQFNQTLVLKLQEITNELVTTIENLANTEKKLMEVESNNSQLEVFIEKKLEKLGLAIVYI